MKEGNNRIGCGVCLIIIGGVAIYAGAQNPAFGGGAIGVGLLFLLGGFGLLYWFYRSERSESEGRRMDASWVNIPRAPGPSYTNTTSYNQYPPSQPAMYQTPPPGYPPQPAYPPPASYPPAPGYAPAPSYGSAPQRPPYGYGAPPPPMSVPQAGPSVIPTPAPPAAPARALNTPPSLDLWEPRAWVAETLYEYEVAGVIYGDPAAGSRDALNYVLLGFPLHDVTKKVALKIPTMSYLRKLKSLNAQVMSEGARMQELSEESPHIVRLLGMHANRDIVDKITDESVLEPERTDLYLKHPPMLILEYLEKETFFSLFNQDAMVQSEAWPKIVTRIGRDTANALTAIHRAGYAHLDVKPGNIFFTGVPPSGGLDLWEALRRPGSKLIVKLGDLGSAARFEKPFAECSPPYASMEQVLGAKLPRLVAQALGQDFAAGSKMDVYSLGASLYRAFSPSNTPNSKDVLTAFDRLWELEREEEKLRVRRMPALPLGTWDSAVKNLRAVWNKSMPDTADVDPALRPMITKMLSRNARDRPNADQVEADLDHLLGTM